MNKTPRFKTGVFKINMIDPERSAEVSGSILGQYGVAKPPGDRLYSVTDIKSGLAVAEGITKLGYARELAVLCYQLVGAFDLIDGKLNAETLEKLRGAWRVWILS